MEENPVFANTLLDVKFGRTLNIFHQILHLTLDAPASVFLEFLPAIFLLFDSTFSGLRNSTRSMIAKNLSEFG